MRPILAAALVIATALPAAAQPAARKPAAAPKPATAEVAGTPGTPGTRTVDARSPEIEASMQRAQKAADDRAKAWDAKMKRTMGSICSGC